MRASRVLVVGNRLDPYPPFNEAMKGAALLLIRHLAEIGARVWVLGFSDQARTRFQVERTDGVLYLIVDRKRLPSGRQRWRMIRSMVEMLRRLGRADVTFFYNMYYPALGNPGRRWLWIASHHFFDEFWAVDERVGIFAENSMLYKLAKERYPHNPIQLRYPGVDLSRFRPRAVFEPGNPVRFLFASSPLPEHATPEKEETVLQNRGVYEILEISSRLARKVPVKTVLLWRKDPTYIRSLIPSSGDVVEVVYQQIEDMSAYMEGFDFYFGLFRDKLHVKGMPQSMVECLAKGIPVVAFRGTSFGDFAEQYDVGITVSQPVGKEDIEMLAEACTDKERYRQMAHNAVQCARECFDVQRLAQDLYTLLVEGK